MQTPGPSRPADRHVRAELHSDPEGRPKYYTLTLGTETVHLDPGKAWVKVDTFKWVTRGLIEEPQSFHVLPTGEVDINGEKIALTDPEGTLKLEREINKHHEVSVRPTAAAPARSAAPATAAEPADRVRFRVHLDPFGHFVIEARRGAERAETGLRGLSSLVHNGLMIAPKAIHVDPLQRAIEIDGVRFECCESGAPVLEAALNEQYAPRLERGGGPQIEVRENAASPTGYDLGFTTLLAGNRVPVKGHLSQAKLDILMDTHKCDLLRPGILLRLSPPLLLLRRRRPDGGEERIPELPDLDYLRSSAAAIQRVLNHPLVRRGQGTEVESASPAAEPPPQLVRLTLTRNAQNRALLWLECHTDRGGHPEGKAFTHHNVAELQHQGIFQPHLDVALSLDHHTLSVLDKVTRAERHVQVSPESSEADLAAAGALLTEALRPPSATAQGQ